ncbi:transposase, partial [Thiolapillus sp.]|uniref:transposase n=1 Tax=Thiolapillus sp. TaxID=2017437 RepID=UPI003AF79B66
SKYDWLTNPDNMTRKQKDRFKALRDSTLKTARAWAIKELAPQQNLWVAEVGLRQMIRSVLSG